MLIQAQNLKPGQLIDLEGDRYADPLRDKPALRAEYQRVADIDCDGARVAIYFDGGAAVECPPHHPVKAAPRSLARQQRRGRGYGRSARLAHLENGEG